MLEHIFWGGVLRFTQSALQAAPTILVGVLLAGVFSRFLGPRGTRRLFGDNTWRSLPQAWVLGMLLPVCSQGVIPAARQLRRSGVAGGTILAFAVTAPLFNPLSLLYGLTLSEPLVILAFAMCSLLVVTVVGIAWDWFFPDTAGEPEDVPPVRQGLKRIVAVAAFCAKEMAGPTTSYILVGLLGVVALSAALPAGSLQMAVEHQIPYAPLIMTGVAIPAYATPMLAMSQIGSMFQHGNSVGAAFILLTLGAGMNLGLMFWIFRNYGLRRTASWMAILCGVVLAIAYSVEGPLYPSAIQPAGHTHAFDVYCSPFSRHTTNLPDAVVRQLSDHLLPHEVASLAVLLSLGLVGAAIRWSGSEARLNAWLESSEVAEDSTTAVPWYERPVPAPALGGIALVGLVLFSVVGCYSYYPAPEDAFGDMRILTTELSSAAMHGDRTAAEHYIPLLSVWSRRIQVGAYLRRGDVTEFQRMKAAIYRDKLELLTHAIAENDREEMHELALAADRAYLRMRHAFLPEQNAP